MKKLFVLIAFASVITMSCTRTPKYLNPAIPMDKRIDDLLSRMTLEQKVSQLNYESAAIDSLHIPAYNWWNECLHGVARAGIATVFPQAIGIAATWDTELMTRIGEVISDEARAKHHNFVSKNKRQIYQGLTFWTPNINIFRDPRWGRGMETYGEDPYLTGKMAVAFVKAMQGNHPTYLKTIATSKHFAVHSGPEPDRHSFDVDVSDYDLRETYLPAFRMTVKEANVQSVMCAYNRFRGKPCCGSDPLLNNILRNEWNFSGYVVSDCWAIRDFYDGHNVVETKAEAAAMAFKNGTDLNCGNSSPALTEAVQKGLITEEEINVALRRLLKARFMLGMFDSADKVPFTNIPYSVVDCDKHKKLALEAAHKSIVLLKNENNILPLSKNLKSIAVIGPNANDVEVLLANYNGIPSAPVTPLQGLKNKLPNTEIRYALGCEHAKDLPVFENIDPSCLFTDMSLTTQGVKAEYFDNADFRNNPIVEEIVDNIDFYWWDKAPKEGLPYDNFGVRFTTVLVPKISGRYAIGSEGKYGYRFYFQDSLLIQYKNEHHFEKKYEFVELKANTPYPIRVDFYHGNGDANMHLLWAVPGKNYEKEALDIAKQSEAIILFMGLSPRLEGEEMKVRVEGFHGGDRLHIGLPELQQSFIKKVAALGKPLVLVLLNGSALSINWEAENIKGIVEAWYPGQAGGTAIADVLFGDYNPAGRLPVTFYKSVNDLPPFDNYDMQGRTYRYFEKEPLFAFGYGLSYTTFSYSAPVLGKSVIQANEATTVTVKISNTGTMKGEEVVQMYVKDKESKDPRPIKTLKGFKRISIDPGQTAEVIFTIGPDELSNWNKEQHAYVVEPGDFIIYIGSSSRNQDLQEVVLNIKE